MKASVRLWFVLPLVAGVSLLLAACDTEEEVVSSITNTPGAATPTATAAPSPASTPSSAASIPADWQTYTDPVAGFSVAYPPDLRFEDVSGPSASDANSDRALSFQSADDPRRGFAIAIVVNTQGLSLDDWVQHLTACAPDTIEESQVAGMRAIRCINRPEELPESAVIFENNGRMFFVTSTLPPSEFQLVSESLQP